MRLQTRGLRVTICCTCSTVRYLGNRLKKQHRIDHKRAKYLTLVKEVIWVTYTEVKTFRDMELY